MTTKIMTPCGEIQGTTCKLPNVTAYKGIRYAVAGRWEYPEIIMHWNGTYDATKYGACSYQPRAFYDEELVSEKAFYYNEFRKGETYEYSEDCLFLNIWTPSDATENSNLPVIVYIHGGGYTGGCGHEKHFDGPVWPTKGVIAVTLNYRLGPIGFACLPELAEEAGHTGNYGLYDQMCALKWVQANIKAFGGNPDNVTIMGQSAGAMSVQQHCLSPLTDGLFSKAVMSSGGGVNKMMSAAPAESRYEFWQNVMKEAGCANLAEFRAVDIAKVFEAWQKVKKATRGAGMIASPVLDNHFVVGGAEIAKNGKHKNIPYMAGSTSHDVMPPMIYMMSRDWNIMQDEQNKHSSYTWFFDRNLPGDNNGAWHSSDLWYWFGTLDNCWRPLTEKDYDLSNQMSSYLTNFAKTGNPNGDKLVHWEVSKINQKKALRLGEKDTHMGNVSMTKLIYTMLTNKAVGE